jgi:cation transport protein ChaC
VTDRAEADPPPERMTLTRELLLRGDLAALIAKTHPDMPLLTAEQRAASLRGILDARPERGGGVWVFAYGSLIWNPAIHVAERRVARVAGWHRAFCLSTKAGRGSPDSPGVMLGLRQGGDCAGAVLRVAEDAIEQELDLLWRREMIADGYIPRWVQVADLDGAPLGHAVAFTINPAGPAYCELPEDEVVRRLVRARGGLGTAYEYLFHLRDALGGLGIADPLVDHLAHRVTAELKAAE